MRLDAASIFVPFLTFPYFFIPAVLALCVALAYAQSDSADCSGVHCYPDLSSCESSSGGSLSDSRASCSSSSHFFKCASSSSPKCREVSTGEVVSIRNNDCHHGIRCFSSLSACLSATPATPFEGGAHPRSDCGASPVYQCREQSASKICRDVQSGYQIRQGAGKQDPHFKGFDGVTFYFEGEPDGVFNVLSDSYLQINAKFILLSELKGTYMGQIGFRFGADQSLIFDPHFGIIINGTLMTAGERTIDGGLGAVAIEQRDGKFVMSMQYGAYSVQVRVQVEQGVRHAAYSNLLVNLVGEPERPHGILGQTLYEREGLIEVRHVARFDIVLVLTFRAREVRRTTASPTASSAPTLRSTATRASGRRSTRQAGLIARGEAPQAEGAPSNLFMSVCYSLMVCRVPRSTHQCSAICFRTDNCPCAQSKRYIEQEIQKKRQCHRCKKKGRNLKMAVPHATYLEASDSPCKRAPARLPS